MKPGDTFLADFGKGLHLHVVLSHPTQEEQLVVATMISTYDEDRKNAACIIRPSDGHPFIKHFSYVVYQEAGLYSVTRINELVHDGTITLKPPFSKDVLERILKGADSFTAMFPNECWLILDRQGLI